MAKDYYLARDAYKLEDLAAKKYEHYAQQSVDPKVKQLFAQIAQVEKETAHEFQQLMNRFPQ